MTVDVPRLFASRRVRWVFIAASVLGLIIGIDTLILHLRLDPLADVRAYYDAGARLNAGQPLYVQPATTDDPGFYRYPPLLAIAFRPLALLPYETAALIWEALPHRPVRRDPGPPRPAQPVDLDRQRLAGGADRVEPGDRPGAGRGHVPRRARIAVGDRAGREPEDPADHRRHLLDRAARLARGRAGDRLADRPGRAVVRARAGRHHRVHRLLRPRPGRQRPEPVALRVLAAAVGRLRHRVPGPRAPLRAEPGRLGPGGLGVGVGQPAPADVPAVDAPGGRPLTRRRHRVPSRLARE